MKIVAWLISLLLALAAAAAEPVERDSRRDSERRQTTEKPRDRESYRERFFNEKSLPAEWQRSPLFRYEGKDARTGEERGMTLRRYVAARPTVEVCREQMLAQELISERQRSGDEPAEKRQYRSLYLDIERTERATRKTIEENQAKIAEWLSNSADKDIEIRYDNFDDPVGKGVSRDGDGRLDLGRMWTSYSSAVRLRKEGSGKYYVRESFPTDENTRGKAVADIAGGTLFRGGERLNARLGIDVHPDKLDGLIHPSRNGKPEGLSLNADPKDPFVQKFGGAFPVISLPEGLQVLPAGREGHYVIAPVEPMPFEKYQQLLHRIQLGNSNVPR